MIATMGKSSILEMKNLILYFGSMLFIVLIYTTMSIRQDVANILRQFSRCWSKKSQDQMNVKLNVN